MQIFYLNNLNDLKKYKNRYKFDSGDFHCIYFGSIKDKNFEIFKKLKIDVFFSDKIYIDKAKFKSDYVEFIGNLSSCFVTKYWWATQTASKFRNQLPFCLYKIQIVSDILNKHPIKKLIVIDESYLFNKTILFFSKNNSIDFYSPIFQSKVMYFNIKSLFLFFAVNIYSFVNILLKILYSKYLFSKKVKQININKSINVIKTFAFENSFNEKHQFIDKFFGELPKYLKNNGYNTVSLVTCLGNYKRILRKINKDDTNIILPIELFIKPKKLVSEFFKIIKLKLKFEENIFFNKIDITEFLNFYLRSNKKNEIQLQHVICYSATKEFLKYFKVKLFITNYENIPWEPMCFLALMETSPETLSIGYQHSNVSDFDTNYFLSGYELSKRPLPDRIYTVGPITKNIIEKNSGGEYPHIESTCALRYKYLHYGTKFIRNKNKRILIALEGIRDVYHLVNYVLDELSLNNNFELIIRPHPILPISKLKKYIEIDYSKLNNISISSGDSIIKDLEQVSVVIYRESAVALEAIAFGLPVICFQSHPVISYDPLFELDDFKWTVDESVKLEPLLNQIIEMDDRSFINEKEKAILYIEDYFKKCTDDKMSMFTNV